jgi:RNA processing factor Prp31
MASDVILVLSLKTLDLSSLIVASEGRAYRFSSPDSAKRPIENILPSILSLSDHLGHLFFAVDFSLVAKQTFSSTSAESVVVAQAVEIIDDITEQIELPLDSTI